MTEYVINRLGLHGDGIADGPFYAAQTLPGERITAEADGNRLREIKIAEPSDHRVSPPCRHFKSCGGCQLQHASDDFVATWKSNIVEQTLKNAGLETDIRPIQTSPAQSRRRATFAARRTKKSAMAGFYGRASETLIEIPDCQLLEPTVKAGLPIAEELARIGASRKGALAVTVTRAEQGLDISVRDGKPLDGPLRQELARLAATTGIARLSWEDETIAMEVPPTQAFGKARVVPPPGSFLQATDHGEAALLTGVHEAVGHCDRVIDLFAGCGTFTLPLAERAEVHAVEGERAMLDALDRGWRQAKGLKKVTTETRDLFRRPLMPDELRHADAIVIDPPRAGGEAQVREICQSPVPRLAYVSCNPVSFARDAAMLVNAGFTLDWVQTVDQFRWSSHIELVAGFTAS